MSFRASLSGHVTRRAEAVARSRMEDEPVVALHGARAVGKSTLLQELASSFGAEVLDLDDLALREAATADPANFVTGVSPVCIDEYQHVPGVLDAIKAELNRDLRAGRFLLTGSTSFDALPLASQSLTGRLHLLSVWPLSQGEIAGVEENLVQVLLDDPMSAVTSSSSSSTKSDYAHRIAAGGFPIALARTTEASRARWFDDYIGLVLQRDVQELAKIRQRDQMPELLRRLAGQTAQVMNLTTISNRSGMSRSTVTEYVGLLEAVFLLYRLEAWGKTLGARVAGTPKIHMVDSGIATRLMRLTPARLSRLDPTSLSEFGHLLETFVVGELLKQVSWLDGIAGCGHWRTHDDDEVDLVIERDDGGVLAFEVKAGSRVSAADLRPMSKLRGAVGDSFVGGVMLYTGPRSYSLDDGTIVLPIDRIWQRL